MATVLVQRGTLKVGDIVVAGAEWGRVRALINDKGEHDRRSRPVRRRSRCSASTARRKPATASSWSRTKPAPARSPSTAPASSARRRRRRGRRARHARPDDGSQLKTGEQQGIRRWSSRPTCRARRSHPGGSLDKLGTDEVERAHPACRRRRHHRKRRHAGQGLRRRRSSASTSAPTTQARDLAKRDGVEIRYYNIIYDLVDDVKGGAVGHAGAEAARDLPRQCRNPARCSTSPRSARSPAARSPRAWCERGANVRLHPRQRRDPRRQAVDAQALQGRSEGSARGQECGMAFANYQDMQEGDVIECFETEMVPG